MMSFRETVANSRLMVWFKNVLGSNKFINFTLKFGLSSVTLIFIFIPTYIYLIARWLLNPVDFWQEFATFAVSCIILGAPQLFFIIFGGIFILLVLLEDW